MIWPLAASDLALLIEAARGAGEIARQGFGRDVKVWSKGAAGPVTEIDLAINVVLRETLTEARPDYGWLSEESPDDAVRQGKSRVFVIDPLDGTRAFIAGKASFTLSLGIAEHGRAFAGVVYDPINNEMFSGGVGAPALRNDVPIRISARDTLQDAALFAPQPFIHDKAWATRWPKLALSSRPSSAYRLALAAAGDVDGVILPGERYLWDIAAGAAILEAAGAVVTDLDGRPIDYNAPHPMSEGVVAAGQTLHALLIERTFHRPGAAESRRAAQEEAT